MSLDKRQNAAPQGAGQGSALASTATVERSRCFILFYCASLFYHLPASAGAIVSTQEGLVRLFKRPPKPRRLVASLGLKAGLRTALEGKVGRGDSLDIFYLN